jgi:hypothetical protein
LIATINLAEELTKIKFNGKSNTRERRRIIRRERWMQAKYSAVVLKNKHHHKDWSNGYDLTLLPSHFKISLIWKLPYICCHPFFGNTETIIFHLKYTLHFKMSSSNVSCSNFRRACVLQYLKVKCKCDKNADVKIFGTDRNPYKLFFSCLDHACGFLDWAHLIGCLCHDQCLKTGPDPTVGPGIGGLSVWSNLWTR